MASFAYRPNFSTEAALLLLKTTLRWLLTMNNLSFFWTLALFLFHTANRRILPERLHDIVFATDWFLFYLTERSQPVFVGGKLSETVSLITWVPQGAVLGPIAYLIVYANSTIIHQKRIHWFWRWCRSVFWRHTCSTDIPAYSKCQPGALPGLNNKMFSQLRFGLRAIRCWQTGKSELLYVASPQRWNLGAAVKMSLSKF